MVEIEAESLGKALIASDIGFTSEAIEDSINGYKVQLGSVDGLVQRVRQLWEAPELCKKIGINARSDYEAKYLPEDNYIQLMKIYNDTLM